VYPKFLLEACQSLGSPKLELVGSHNPGDTPGIRHEGYGGWTAERFATHFTGMARTGDYSKRGSPFLYQQPNGTPKLDFKQYCQDVNGGKTPDLVTIFLGPNDIFSYQDENIEGGIDRILKYYDQLIQMVRTDSPATRIGVMLPVPPAASQDAFGANYTNGQTRWQYKRNQHRLVERMLQAYANRSSENIDLIATYVNLDCVHNYPGGAIPANSRTTTAIFRQNNGVHPAGTGYQQIGDSVYGWIKATSQMP
jgi:lysophospholipase L1-like esterase